MIDQILIDVSPGETRIAHLCDGRLVEVFHERLGGESLIGDIFAGRVVRIVPALKAAFVDIGQDKPGFLPLRKPLTEGAKVPVLVTADPHGDKGAKLNCEISLPGRFMVGVLGKKEVSFSKKIGGNEAKAAIYDAISAYDGDGTSFVVRTSAATAAPQDLAEDANALKCALETVRQDIHKAKPPQRIHRGSDPLERLLKTLPAGDTPEIVVSDGTVMSKLKALAAQVRPDLVDAIKLHTAKSPLFSLCETEAQIEEALLPEVPLHGGGELVIETTAALTAVDVNASERNALETNIEAATELFHQLRLRAIGGQILVDFISMKNRQAQTRLIEHLRKLARQDGQSHIIGTTGLGLVEMTRERRRQSLCDTLLAKSNYIALSPRSAALSLLRDAITESRFNPGKPVTMAASSDVLGELRGPLADALAETETRMGCPLNLIEDTGDDE